jgi:hypothetical protein
MPLLFRWFAIICAVFIALSISGCSAVRLGYNNAPTLAYWWLDGYFDFTSSQSTAMRADLAALQDWHRKEELPLIAEVFKNLQTTAPGAVTTEQVCSLYAYVQTRVLAASDRFAPAIATVGSSLQPSQLEHIARSFDKRNKQWREDWLDGSPAERADRRVKQLQERAESFYGRLEPSQVALLRQQVSNSDFDPALNYRETLRRQQDALQTLRELRSSNVSEAQAQSEIRALLARAVSSPDPTFRSYVATLTNQSCAAVAALHNATSTTQRQRLTQTLQDYETDVRVLMQRP